MKIICGKTGDTEDVYDADEYEDERVLYDVTESSDVQRPFYWSQQLQQSFREELEKFVLSHLLSIFANKHAMISPDLLY
jgi:phosphatidylinositol 4-kinase type 2